MSEPDATGDARPLFRVCTSTRHCWDEIADDGDTCGCGAFYLFYGPDGIEIEATPPPGAS